eukprot:Transcript_17215.p1 GENE.Transcript_17215~~Transcript_17215.p1  ORF type:complete len:704 (-),score=227.76 Transcript_17215:191-2302(-)
MWLRRSGRRTTRCCRGLWSVPTTHVEDGERLGLWLQVQRRRWQARGWSEEERKAKKVSPLSDEEVARLEAVGVVWDVLAAQWEKNYALLQRFVEREGHANVPATHVEDGEQLGAWLRTQRTRWQARGERGGAQGEEVERGGAQGEACEPAERRGGGAAGGASPLSDEQVAGGGGPAEAHVLTRLCPLSLPDFNAGSTKRLATHAAALPTVVASMTSIAIRHPKQTPSRPSSRPSTAQSSTSTGRRPGSRATKSFGSDDARTQARPGSAVDESRPQARPGTAAAADGEGSGEAVRTAKASREAVLEQQDRELQSIETEEFKRKRDAASEFERKRNAARERKRSEEMEEELLKKLLARTPNGARSSAAPKLLLRTFCHYDRDGDGTVSFDEFKQVAARLGMITQKEPTARPQDEEERRRHGALRVLYDKHDRSGCGYLDYKVFCGTLAGHEMLDQGPPPPTVPDGLSDNMQAVTRRSTEMGAALRGRMRSGPEGRQMTREQEDCILQQAPAQRQHVREALDQMRREQKEAEELARRRLVDDSRRRHAAAEMARLEQAKKAREAAVEEAAAARKARLRLQQHETAIAEEQEERRREMEARTQRQWKDQIDKDRAMAVEQRRQQQEFRREYDKQLKEEKRQRAQQAAAARAHPRPGSAARVGGGAPSRSGLKAWSGSAPRPNSALRELKASRPNLGTAADSLDKLRM